MTDPNQSIRVTGYKMPLSVDQAQYESVESGRNL